MGFLVIVVLAVVIFIGLKNKKKIAAEQQKDTEEKMADQKAATEKAAIEKAAAEKAAAEKAAAEKAAAEKAAAEKAAAEKAVIAPFSSKEAKQYYEMAYGLLSSSSEERSLDDIRRFVEFHTSRVEVFDYKKLILPSDEAKKFLKEGTMCSCSLFNSDENLTKTLTSKGVSSDQIEQIIKLNKSLDESLAYRYTQKDADTICDPKNYEYNGFGTSQTVVCKIPKGSIILLKDQPESIRNNTTAQNKTTTQKNTDSQNKQECSSTTSLELHQEIKKDCKEVFDNCFSCEPDDLIKEFYKCFQSRRNNYINMIRGKNILDAGYEAEDIFCEVLYDNYFDNLKCVLVDTFNKILSEKRDLRCKLYGADKYMIIAAKQAAAITLRALNYEKHGQNKEEYLDITKDICREFISNYEIFKNEDENKVASDLISEISGNLSGGGRWYLPYDLKVYHIDTVCYAFWKSVAAKYQDGDSTDPNYIFNMFLDCFKPNQDKLDHLAVEHRRHMELEARKKAVRRQCEGCARCDYCGERYKRENCPAWIPKQR